MDNMIVSSMKPVALIAARTVAAHAVSFVAQKALDGSSALPAVASLPVLALRGGGEGAMDLTRVRIRLEGLHAYGVVSTLMLNASLRLFSSAPKPRTPVKGETINNIARVLFTISIGASVLAGVYTTVVFSMLGLYCKSAIGMGKDEACLQFMAATENMRKSAFDTFLIALVSFKASFVLSLFLNYEGEMRWWTAGIAAVISLLSWWHWHNIMSVAGKLLFN